MGTSLWKMCLDTDPLSDLLEHTDPTRTEKKYMQWTGRMWGTCHCLGNNLPKHLIKGHATNNGGTPITDAHGNYRPTGHHWIHGRDHLL